MEQGPTAGVQVEIGELVLEGFAPGERHRIGAAVEHELARLIGERGWHEGLSSAARIDAGAFEIPAGASAGAIGERIALAVYLGLTR